MSNATFPEIVRCRSSIVTIYHILNRGKDHFTLSYYEANGKRQRQMFRDYETAKEAAKSVAAEIAAGGTDVLTVSGKERLCYERAMEALRPLRMDVDTAVMQLVEAVKILNHTGSVVEAAKCFVRQHSTTLPVKSVREVVDELLDEKKQAGVSRFHWKDLRSRLVRFAEAFHCPLTSVTAVEIQQFLVSLGLGLRSRRNYRQSIGTLFNFAKAHHYLKPDHLGISDVPKVPKRGPKISVFSPEEITKLLSGAKSELISALALGAFAGVRTEEIKRLRWNHIKLARGLIDVPSEVTKTQSRRLVPISDNLRQWLLPFVRDDGPVVPYSNLSNQFLKTAKRLNVSWRRNVLRHSFISYRVAQTGDIARTSLEAGNSPKVIKQDYLEIVDEDTAKDWFSISPPINGEIIVLRTAEQTSRSKGQANAVASGTGDSQVATASRVYNALEGIITQV
jgi:integrase